MLVSLDNRVELWYSEGKVLKKLPLEIEAGILSPDEKMIASVSDSNTIKLWDLNGTLLQILKGHSDVVRDITFSPDSKMLVSTGADLTIKFWSLNGTLLQTFHGHELSESYKQIKVGITALAFNPNGTILASAGSDGQIILWNLNIDDLVERGCNWVRGYLKNNKNINKEDQHLCEDIGNSQ